MAPQAELASRRSSLADAHHNLLPMFDDQQVARKQEEQLESVQKSWKPELDASIDHNNNTADVQQQPRETSLVSAAAAATTRSVTPKLATKSSNR